MKTQARVWAAGAILLALGLGVYLTGRGTAGEGPDTRKAILDIAKKFEKGDKEAARKQAQAFGKDLEEVHEVMDLFRPRTKKGLGVGPKAGVATPDGIELKLNALGRDAPGAAALGREAAAIEQMAYATAAIAEVTAAKAPEKDEPGKKRKDWVKWSNEMTEASLQLAAAAKEKSAQDIKAAASKVNNSCNSCHSAFRD